MVKMVKKGRRCKANVETKMDCSTTATTPSTLATDNKMDVVKDDENEFKIILKSRDNVSFCVEIDVACLSYTIRTMVEHLADASGRFCDQSNEDAIILSNIDSWALEKVIDWCRAHKNDEKQQSIQHFNKFDGPSFELNLTTWDKEFFRMRRQRWIELVRAANFLDVRGLLETLCMLMAKDLEKNSVEYIRQLYNIKNDFTEEEEKQIIAENQKLKIDYI